MDREALSGTRDVVDESVRQALTERGLTIEEVREALAEAGSDGEREAWLAERLGDLDVSLDLPPASALPAPEDPTPALAEGADEGLVDLPEGAEPAALQCLTGTSVSSGFTRADTSNLSQVNRATGMIRAHKHASTIDGEQKDIHWIEQDVLADRTHNQVRATVRIVDGFNEAWAAPLLGYAASGINLTLEVRDGARVVCTDRRVLRENYVPGGHAGGDLRLETLLLSCAHDRDAGASNTLRARVVLESWVAGGGLARAEAKAEVDVVNVTSRRCAQTVAWCTGGRVHTGDFDGDGRSDLLCHHPDGRREVDLAATGGLDDRTDRNHTNSWCSVGELLVGDVNGDGRDDLVCKLGFTGLALIDWADANGALFGTNTRTAVNFCLPGQWHLGDVDADGDDDLLCHDGTSLTVSLASSGRFSARSDLTNATVCPRTTMNLHVADVNGDGRDDLVCHHPVLGTQSVDLAARAPAVYGTIDGAPSSWCRHTGAQMTMADANGDGRADAICATSPAGDVHIDFAAASGRVFDGGAIFRALSFCTGSNRRLLRGQFDPEGPNEGLLCDDSTGRTIRAALF